MRECTTLEAESICVALYCHACCAFCTCCRISLRATALQGRRLQGFNTNHTYHHICVFASGLVPKQFIQFGRKGQTKEYLWRKRMFSLDAAHIHVCAITNKRFSFFRPPPPHPPFHLGNTSMHQFQHVY